MRARARRAAGGAARSPARYRRRGTLDHEQRVALLLRARRRVPRGRARASPRRSRPRSPTACARAALAVVVPPGCRRLAPGGVELVEDDGADAAELDALDGVLTGCTVAIAETGTIVLAAGPREGRRALTLVPDLHVCVVSERQIVELVPEAMEPLATRGAAAAAHVRLGAVGDLGHRAQPRRGRARAAHLVVLVVREAR